MNDSSDDLLLWILMIAKRKSIKYNDEKIYIHSETGSNLSSQYDKMLVSDFSVYETIKNSVYCLKQGGRLVVITFHSLEDRAVKNAMVDLQGKCTCPSELPYCVCNYESFGKIINKKPIVASEEEKERNSRSKSAKVRIFERLDKNT